MFNKELKDVNLRKYERDSENRVIINMMVKDDSDFLSVFSFSDIPVISSEVADFIETNTQLIPAKEQLALHIYSNCIDDNEKKQYTNAIRQYYSERSYISASELKRNNIIVYLLSISGVLVLILALFLEYKVANLIWAEVIDIVAWVLLWEAVDISFFENRSLRIKNHRYHAYRNMDIKYIDTK